MATRAERFRNEVERSGTKRAPTAKKRPRKGSWSAKKAHAERKATHAFEPHADGERPSRTSTRAAANRAKADSPLNRREEGTKGSPTARARRARAGAGRVRGSSASR